MYTRYLAFIPLLLGLYLLLNATHIVYLNNIYILFIFILLVPLIILFTKFNIFSRAKKIILKSIIKNSIYEIEVENNTYYFIGFKIIGKESNDMKIDYNSELQSAIETIKRNKDMNMKVAIVTLLDPIPGSAIIFYLNNNDEKEFIRETLLLKNLIESVAPHIILEPISLNTNPILPIPKVLGSVIYSGYVGQTKFDVKADRIITGNYDIEIGNIIEYAQIPIGIKSEDVFKHIGIFGSTGSGKSNTASVLAKELVKKGFDVIILDWHGEYKNVLHDFNNYGYTNYLVLNPLQSNELTTMDITEIIGDVLELTEPQKFILYLGLEMLEQIGKFSFKNLLEILASNISENTYMQRDIKFALMRKIVMLFSGLGEKLFSSDNGYNYLDLGEKMVGGNIIDLSFIKNYKLRKLYALMILKFLFEYAIESRNNNRKIFIIVEEAQNYFNQANIVINRALQEIRKFNVGLCIISQSPSNVDPEVIKNTTIKIIHSIKSNVDKKVISESLSLDRDKIQLLDKLDTGEALLVAPNLRKEVLIKVKKSA